MPFLLVRSADRALPAGLDEVATPTRFAAGHWRPVCRKRHGSPLCGRARGMAGEGRSPGRGLTIECTGGGPRGPPPPGDPEVEPKQGARASVQTAAPRSALSGEWAF